MHNTVLLSEIHPAGARYFNPLDQAMKWFNLVTMRDINIYKEQGLTDFHHAISLIEGACSKKGSTLVIRDWSHLDYHGLSFINPSYESSIVKSLNPHFEIKRFSMVRHPISQWASLSRLLVIKNSLDLNSFLHGYNLFAKHAVTTGYIKYEDFTRDPDTQLSLICNNLLIKYDKGYKKRWYLNMKVTGDLPNQMGAPNIIRPASLPDIKNDLSKRFADNKDYNEAISLLGYSHPTNTNNT